MVDAGMSFNVGGWKRCVVVCGDRRMVRRIVCGSVERMRVGLVELERLEIVVGLMGRNEFCRLRVDLRHKG